MERKEEDVTPKFTVYSTTELIMGSVAASCALINNIFKLLLDSSP